MRPKKNKDSSQNTEQKSPSPAEVTPQSKVQVPGPFPPESVNGAMETISMLSGEDPNNVVEVLDNTGRTHLVSIRELSKYHFTENFEAERHRQWQSTLIILVGMGLILVEMLICFDLCWLLLLYGKAELLPNFVGIIAPITGTTAATIGVAALLNLRRRK